MIKQHLKIRVIYRHTTANIGQLAAIQRSHWKWSNVHYGKTRLLSLPKDVLHKLDKKSFRYAVAKIL